MSGSRVPRQRDRLVRTERRHRLFTLKGAARTLLKSRLVLFSSVVFFSGDCVTVARYQFSDAVSGSEACECQQHEGPNYPRHFPDSHDQNRAFLARVRTTRIDAFAMYVTRPCDGRFTNGILKTDAAVKLVLGDDLLLRARSVFFLSGYSRSRLMEVDAQK